MGEQVRFIFSILRKTISRYPEETITFEFKEELKMAERPPLHLPYIHVEDPIPVPSAVPFVACVCSPVVTGKPNLIFGADAKTDLINKIDFYRGMNNLDELIATQTPNEITFLGRLTRRCSLSFIRPRLILDGEVEIPIADEDDDRMPTDYLGNIEEFFSVNAGDNYAVFTNIAYPDMSQEVTNCSGYGYIGRIFSFNKISDEPLIFSFKAVLLTDIPANDSVMSSQEFIEGKTVIFLNPRAMIFYIGMTNIPIPNVLDVPITLVNYEDVVSAYVDSFTGSDGQNLKTMNDVLVSGKFSNYPLASLMANRKSNPVPGGTRDSIILSGNQNDEDALFLNLSFFYPRSIDFDSSNPIGVEASKGPEVCTGIENTFTGEISSSHEIVFKFFTETNGVQDVFYTISSNVRNLGYMFGVNDLLEKSGNVKTFFVQAELNFSDYFNADEFFYKTLTNKILICIKD